MRHELRRRRGNGPQQPKIERMLITACDAEGADDDDPAMQDFHRTFTPTAVRGLIALALELDDRLQAAYEPSVRRAHADHTDLSVPYDDTRMTTRCFQIDAWLERYHGNKSAPPYPRPLKEPSL